MNTIKLRIADSGKKQKPIPYSLVEAEADVLRYWDAGSAVNAIRAIHIDSVDRYKDAKQRLDQANRKLYGGGSLPLPEQKKNPPPLVSNAGESSEGQSSEESEAAQAEEELNQEILSEIDESPPQ